MTDQGDIVAKMAQAAQDKLNSLEATWIEGILNEYIEPWLVSQVHNFKHPQYDFYLSMVRDVMDREALYIEQIHLRRPEILNGNVVTVKRAGIIVAEKEFIISTREI